MMMQCNLVHGALDRGVRDLCPNFTTARLYYLGKPFHFSVSSLLACINTAEYLHVVTCLVAQIPPTTVKAFKHMLKGMLSCLQLGVRESEGQTTCPYLHTFPCESSKIFYLSLCLSHLLGPFSQLLLPVLPRFFYLLTSYLMLYVIEATSHSTNDCFVFNPFLPSGLLKFQCSSAQIH